MTHLSILSIVVLLPLAIGASWLISRKHLYTKFDKRPISGAPSVATVPSRMQTANDSFLKYHEAANKTQTYFQATMIIAISSVLTGFLLLAWLLSFKVTDKAQKTVIYLADFSLLLAAAVLFIIARKYANSWIRQRAVVECVRRVIFLEFLFISSDGKEGSKKFTSIDEIYEFYCIMEETAPDTLSFCTDAYLDYTSRLENLVEDIDLSPDEIKDIFKSKRLLRQHRWFNLAKQRLHSQLLFRERSLEVIFIAAIVIAALKVVNISYGFGHQVPFFSEILAFGSLASIALTAALAAFVMNQSSHALYSRYSEQSEKLMKISEKQLPVSEVVSQTEASLDQELRFFVKQMLGQKVEFSL